MECELGVWSGSSRYKEGRSGIYRVRGRNSGSRCGMGVGCMELGVGDVWWEWGVWIRSGVCGWKV